MQVEVQYPQCARDPQGASGTGPVPVGLVGLDQSAAARILRGYRITTFTRDRIVLVRTLPDCRDSTYTLQSRAGFVVVRPGPPGDPGRAQPTNIPTRSLGPARRRGLEAGIAVPATALDRTLDTLRQEAAPSAPGEP